MKRVLIVILSFSWLYCASPGTDSSQLQEIEPNRQKLIYFKEDYKESRDLFRALGHELTKSVPGSECGVLAVSSKEYNDLTIDWCYVPPKQRKGDLLILMSGTHGAEGPAGAAVQNYFINEIVPGRDRSTSGYLFIHAVNPYGFHAFRRVTENNVDLNRNFDFDGDGSLYQTENTGYGDLNDFLNPEEPASTNSPGYLFFTARAINKILWNGLPVLRQAILQGQYEYPKGIYYGGSKPEQQRKLLEPLFRRKAAGYNAILAVDLHTGYGQRGVLHLFPNDPKTEQVKTATNAIFAGYQIDWGSSDDFYTISGQFTDWILTVTPKNSLYVPMVFEYGTLDSQTTSGSIESIKRTILENQGHFHGYTSDEQKKEILSNYREMFYPSSKHWRMKILTDTNEVWETILPRLKKLGQEAKNSQ